MTDGLRTLLQGALDYAGLFPPAQLSLDAAIRNYARYQQQAESWMLGRFVIPAARLPELDPYVEELFAAGLPLPLAALGRGGDTAGEWMSGIRADAEAIAACRDRHGGRVRIDVVETRLAGAVLKSAVGKSFSDCVQVAIDALGRNTALFVETPVIEDHLAALHAGGAGFKVRCGGLTASAFPSAEQLTAAIRAGAQAQVPLKLTAGLHHPLPRFDTEIGATMHGFINVLAAGVLTAAGSADARVLVEVLHDADPMHFTFDEGLTWKDHKASPAEIAAARREAVLSLGSCELDEPRADLRALGWL